MKSLCLSTATALVERAEADFIRARLRLCEVRLAIVREAAKAAPPRKKKKGRR